MLQMRETEGIDNLVNNEDNTAPSVGFANVVEVNKHVHIGVVCCWCWIRTQGRLHSAIALIKASRASL